MFSTAGIRSSVYCNLGSAALANLFEYSIVTEYGANLMSVGLRFDLPDDMSCN